MNTAEPVPSVIRSPESAVWDMPGCSWNVPALTPLALAAAPPSDASITAADAATATRGPVSLRRPGRVARASRRVVGCAWGATRACRRVRGGCVVGAARACRRVDGWWAGGATGSVGSGMCRARRPPGQHLRLDRDPVPRAVGASIGPEPTSEST